MRRTKPADLRDHRPWRAAQLASPESTSEVRCTLGGLLPKYVDFRCADDGTMWLRPLDLERGGLGGGRAWVRIARDGGAQEIRFPERLDPHRFTPDRVWGVLRDEMDVPSAAWVATPR